MFDDCGMDGRVKPLRCAPRWLIGAPDRPKIVGEALGRKALRSGESAKEGASIMSICRFPLVMSGALIAIGALSACESMPMVQTGKPVTMVEMKATMTTALEVPPKSGSGQGYAMIGYNEGTRALTWKIYYTGLSGPATAAHFHGPAEVGANAGVAIPLAAGAPSSPITGSATLTEAQAAQLTSGMWYVNVHTQANPGGEIRGQVMPEAW
jgi:hypothetical protein